MNEPAPENFSRFERLLVALAKSAVDFAVVGGVAVSLNGFVRATDDVDILIHESPENVRRLLDCLSHWGEGWARELKVEEFLPQEGSIRVIEESNSIFSRGCAESRSRISAAACGLSKRPVCAFLTLLPRI